MDSLIQSLKNRFSETNTSAFALYKLHPAQLKKANRSEYKALVQTIQQFYSFDNFEKEAMLSYDMQKQGLLSQSENLELDFIDLCEYRTLSCRTSSVYNLADPACHYLHSRNIIYHIKKGQNMVKNGHV